MAEAETPAGHPALTLTVNGEMRSFASPLTVLGLLEALGLHKGRVAVERNLEIVPRSLHGATALADGDRIEIVRFIGGG
jgi:thiamine biosynthesis protein ThiS